MKHNDGLDAWLTALRHEMDYCVEMLEEKTNRIDQIYSDITGKSAEQFEKELENLPQRMWVE